MNKIVNTYLLVALVACTAVTPINAHHGNSIAAGFMGAGLGMMAGMALADHHHSHHHSHHVHHHHVSYQPRPLNPVYTYQYTYQYTYPCHYSRIYPCNKVYVYEDCRPCHDVYYDYPCTEIHINKHHHHPCFHNSLSLGFYL